MVLGIPDRLLYDSAISDAIVSNFTISVVMPSYNSMAYIAAAIDSVLRQTHPVTEIIVVDDGSIDATRDIVATYPEVIRVGQNHLGPSAARNKGVREARGQWIAFLDSDDLWHPQKIEKQILALAAYPAAAFCFSTLTSFHMESGTPLLNDTYVPSRLREWINRRVTKEGWACGDVYRLLLETNCVHTSSVLARRAALIDAGLFDETLVHGEDHDLWLRLARRWPAVFLKDEISQYRIHSESISGELLGREDLFYRSSIQILSRHHSQFPSFSAAKALASAHNQYAVFQIKRQRWSEARRLAAKGLRTLPMAVGFRLWLEAAFPRVFSHAVGLTRGRGL